MSDCHVRLSMTDNATVEIVRGRRIIDSLHIGPNAVHACIVHGGNGRYPKGHYEDLGISYNVLITASAGGRDQIAAQQGGLLPTGGQGNPATAATATTFTATGTPWTTNLLAGLVVVFPITGLTTEPVFGIVTSNTTSVATVDRWHKFADDTTGTTPANTSSFGFIPGGAAGRYMGLTADTGAASASDTSLASEILTSNALTGLGRGLATYAHTLASGTYTLQRAFGPLGGSGTITVHKMGIFTANAALASPSGSMIFETVLNADAVVTVGDTLTVTETVTLS